MDKNEQTLRSAAVPSETQPGSPARTQRAAPCPHVDAESFDELVHARVVKVFGAPLDVVAPDPELREVVYDAVAKSLRRPKRPIPPDSLEFAARMNASGLCITPGTSDLRDLPEPLDLGWSLSEAIVEYRRAGL
jgi:hypothetical protein